ncbi:MAG: ATP-binding cassette domain-containing protein [Clostridiales bacterium]|nr:ATP-binding cassette domain-containing protein [Clostridiales bacterium]
MASFALEHLTFSYPGQTRPALDDLTLTIPEGAVTVLCGESGSGKSTLLRQLKTCLTPHGEAGGTVRFGDALLKDIPFAEQARRIGFVLQHPDDQIVTDKVFHELAFGLESLGCGEKTMRLRVAEMASYFGIADWFERDVQMLSGGQKQMLNLASVVVMRPDVLVLDEPTSQLDPIAASTFLHTLRKLNEELGLTILLSEQRLEEAVPLADHLIVLEGRAYLRGYAQHPLPETKSAPAQAQPVLTVRDGWLRYAQNAPDVLRNFSLALRPGELYALTGSNGSGKTTALGVLAGQLRLYRGSVYLDGKKQRALQPLRDGIAAVPQDPRTLFAADTVRADLASLGRDAALLDTVVQQMALAPLLERHPFDLSGGEQQRAALAKVLLMQPRVLLLDEPTKGMDGAFKAEFGALLRKLCAQGTAVCIVSHDVEFCAQYADRCGLLFRGEVVTENDPRAFFSGNYFYTTAAARIARTAAPGAVLCEEVVQCLAD